jgi:hypothetical protein
VGNYKGAGKNNRFLEAPLFLSPVVFVILLAGCGFASFEEIGYRTYPEKSYTVIPHAETALTVRFDTAVDKASAENAIQILSPMGVIEGKLVWNKNELVFEPSSLWKAGIRYVMRLSGTVFSLDGRELALSRDIPFYALAKAPLPNLVSYSPEDGASIEVLGDGNLVLELRFSVPMEKHSVETALSLDTPGEKIFTWHDNDTVLRVFTEKQLSPWTSYRWSVSEKAQSSCYAPLAEQYGGKFITDKDKLFPRVLKVIPLIEGSVETEWGLWTALDFNLESGLDTGQAIGIAFNKPISEENPGHYITFDPSLSGRAEKLSPAAVLFIPDQDPEPETVYTLKISGDLKDETGLKMGTDHVVQFNSALTFLKTLSITPDKAAADHDYVFGKNKIIKTEINKNDGGSLGFTVYFSLPFSKEAQADAAFRINLEPYFPGTLKPVSLRFMRWIARDRLRMEWEGLEEGKPEEPHYYRLKIPGGRSGISNGGGSYFKEDEFIVFEAEN